MMVCTVQIQKGVKSPLAYFISLVPKDIDVKHRKHYRDYISAVGRKSQIIFSVFSDSENISSRVKSPTAGVMAKNVRIRVSILA